MASPRRKLPTRNSLGATWARKFNLLMWKNFKIQIRNKFQTVIEIFIPLMFLVAFAYLRVLLPVERVEQPTVFKGFDVKAAPQVVKTLTNKIAYTPSSPYWDAIMNDVKENFFTSRILKYSIESFESEEEMEAVYANSTKGLGGHKNFMGVANVTSPYLAGIVFPDVEPNENTTNIEYKLRFPAYQRSEFDVFSDRLLLKPSWFTETLYPVFVLPGPRAAYRDDGGLPGYQTEGFLYLQNAIDNSIVRSFLNETQKKEYEKYSFRVQRFPYAPFVRDDFSFALQVWFNFFMVFAFVYPVMSITKMIVHEKECRLKEYMKIMGLPNWLHWTAWFLKSLAFLTLTMILIVILVKIMFTGERSILTETNSFVFLLVLICHATTVIGFCFFMSAVFSTANTAATAAGFLWVLNYIPFGFFFPRVNMMTRVGKYMSCFLLSNIPLSYACYIFAMCENDSHGIQWENLLDGITPDDSFCILDCMVMMIVNSIVSMTAGFYIELVWPGKYGVPLPWYFPFTKWYWTDGIRKEPPRGIEPGVVVCGNFEPDPVHLKPYIEIKGLTKAFGENVAVNKLSIKFFENQVTSLLGHNGAGKTTTMSMLTGLVNPTSGTAVVNGYDICKNMRFVRANLGLCPQYNVLFDELTVEEHIKFFSLLKGCDPSEVDDEVDRMIEILEFESKRHAQSKDLSGGMKRKLSVGIAFCAGSKAVLLDEPSSGMDPRTRRSTWDLIQSEKFGRTVILSTHFMEEADLLGDRIAIMSHGRLKCVGKSLFLKKKYGGFHNLVIVKQNSCLPNKITDFLQKKIPRIQLNDDVGAELSYSMPDDESSKYANLFEDLELKKSQLGISSFGVSNTSMEEVFMRVVKPDSIEAYAKNHQNGQNGSSNGHTIVDNIRNGDAPDSPLLKKGIVVDGPRYEKLELFVYQFKAIIVKKLLILLRNRGLAALQIAIPIVVLAVAMACFKTLPGISTPRSLHLNLDRYENLGRTLTITNCDPTDKLCGGYRDFVSNSYQMENFERGSLSEIYLNKSGVSLRDTLSKVMIGMEQVRKQTSSGNSTEVTAFFNNRPFHNPPLSLNFISNGALQAFGVNKKIALVNHPFDYNDFDNVKQAGDVFTLSFISAWAMQFVLGIMGSAFIIFPVQERIIGAKHLQFVAGVKAPIYWAASAMIDIINYMIPTALMLLVLIVLNIEQFQHLDVIMWFFILCFAHAWSMVGVMALFSFVFTIPSGGFARMTLSNSMFGLAALMLVVNLESPELGMTELATMFHNILVCFPNYALGMGIAQLTVNKDLKEFCQPFDLEVMCPLDENFICCRKYAPTFYDWKVSGIGKNLLSLFTCGALCFLAVFCIEMGIFTKIKATLSCFHGKRKNSNEAVSTSERSYEFDDEDVQREAERINSQSLISQFKTHNLVIRNLTKVYNERMTAVKKLNLGVAKGETFGLLGVNGAGKTTTFKMITGDISITSGDVYLCRNNVKRNLAAVYENLGYCPQFDAVIEQLTGRETIQMFANLRGIKESHIDRIVNNLAENLLFTQHIDKKVGLYSGGNKRKLSTAVAMLGNPPVVFLDEPTTGLDPVARRHVWNAINRLRESGTSVVITSHCMEECEALCSRIAIMVDGRFRCLGSPQHLKNKFGEGYSIVAQLNYTSTTSSKTEQDNIILGNMQTWEQDLQGLKDFIKNHFPGCELKDSHPGFVQYHVPKNNTKWANLFAVMEQAKEKFDLEAYSVGQTSLEQVFFNFTKLQESFKE